jgi:hypothetical protein
MRVDTAIVLQDAAITSFPSAEAVAALSLDGGADATAVFHAAGGRVGGDPKGAKRVGGDPKGAKRVGGDPKGAVRVGGDPKGAKRPKSR